MTFNPNCSVTRSLTKRTRPAEIARELEELGRLPRGVLLQRVRGKETRIARETLVSLARTFRRRDDNEAVHIVLEALIARVSGALRSRLQGWHVLAADREDLQSHVVVGLCGYWLNTETGEELWECNFTTPFLLRTTSLVDSFFRKTVRTTSLTTVYGYDEDTGAERDIADPASALPYEEIIRNMPERAALQELAAHNALWSRALHDKYIACYTEEEIGKRFGVTARTIRNWLKEARLFLQARIAGENA